MVDTAAGLLMYYAGLDTNSEHGKDTPGRFITMLDELTKCKSVNNNELDDEHIKACIKWKTFEAERDDMITMAGIPFVSLCNHHVIPFIGKAHIGYIPNKHIVGLSKIARVVGHFARQLQIQEQLTNQIGQFLQDKLDPQGVAVVIQAEHYCMTIRGVQAPGTITTTSTMRGHFGQHERTAKAEFMQIIGSKL